MAKRSTMNVSLPKALKDFVDQEVDRGGYGTASEYMRALIRDRKSAAVSAAPRTFANKRELEKHLTDSIDAGGSIEVTPEYAQKLRQRLRAKRSSGRTRRSA